MNRIILLALFLIGLNWTGIAQEADNLQSQTYYYSVSNVTSEDQLQEVFNEFENLKFVTKVKLNYKPEKPSMAQFIVYVTEPKRTNEAQVMFELTDLKKIVINHDLSPTDLKIDNH